MHSMHDALNLKFQEINKFRENSTNHLYEKNITIKEKKEKIKKTKDDETDHLVKKITINLLIFILLLFFIKSKMQESKFHRHINITINDLGYPQEIPSKNNLN